MIKEFLKALSGDTLLNQAIQQVEEMLAIAEEMFHETHSRILCENPATFSVHKRDKDINQLESEVRRKVLEHLSINTKPDIVGSLVLTTVTGYIERIGDNVKQFTELEDHYGKPFPSLPQFSVISGCTETILLNFGLTRKAIHDEDEASAESVITNHRKIRDRLNTTLKSVYGEKGDYDKNAALTEVLYARGLKRINANLKNIATSVIKPYDEIGYTRKLRDDD